MSGILVGLLCMVTGCSGTEAQEPSPDLSAAAPRAVKRAPVPPAQASEPTSIADMNVPWAIALLSDAPEPPRKKPSRKVTVVVTQPPAPSAIEQEADLHVAIKTASVIDKPVEEKPAPVKVCPGVVNRRS
jgi:hypothetical protein